MLQCFKIAKKEVAANFRDTMQVLSKWSEISQCSSGGTSWFRVYTDYRYWPDQTPEAFLIHVWRWAVSPQQHRTCRDDSLNPRARRQHWNQMELELLHSKRITDFNTIISFAAHRFENIRGLQFQKALNGSCLGYNIIILTYIIMHEIITTHNITL